MRNEYFTVTELARIMNVGREAIIRRINTEGYFPAVCVGNGSRNRRMIIDKKKFFDWFWRVERTRVIYEMFPASELDIEGIKKAYAEFVDWSRTKYHQDIQYKITYIDRKRAERNARHERRNYAYESR